MKWVLHHRSGGEDMFYLTFKKSDMKVALNYIFVSLTTIVCELLENIVRVQVCGFLAERNYRSGWQHGFS